MGKKVSFIGIGLVFFTGHLWAAFPPTSITKPLIQIGVEVVEVDQGKTEKLGIQWISHINVSEVSVPAVLQLGTLTRSNLFADLDLMLQEGTADLLANPKLVTRDGTTAEFHAGGELPYATSTGTGSTSIEFKTYGVDLRINPHLEEDGKIALMVDAQVSAPDEQNSVTLSGNQVPGILSRQVISNVTLNPNTTLTLAGLLQNQKQIQWQRVPFLGHIPLLGLLFSHKVVSHKHTSIVVFVTPTVLEGDQGIANPS